MEKSYKDEGVNIFMSLEDVEIPVGSYEIAMLQKNRIACLLPMEIRCLDGEDIPYYQVNGIAEFCELKSRNAMGPRHIIRALRDVLTAAHEVGEYLLSPNNIVFDWDYIFREESSGYFKFVYLPGYDKNLRSQLKLFLEKALKEMDHTEEVEADFVYGLYDICAKDKFDLKGLAQEIGEFLGGKRKEDFPGDGAAPREFIESAFCEDVVGENQDCGGATEVEISREAQVDKLRAFDEIPMDGKDQESRKWRIKTGRSGKKSAEDGGKNESHTFILVIALSVFVLIAYSGLQFYRYGGIVEYKKLMALLVLVMAEIFVFMELSERRKQELALATAGGGVVPAPAERVVMQARINDDLRDEIPRRSRRIRTEVEEDDDQGSRWANGKDEDRDVRPRQTEEGRGQGVSRSAHVPRDFDVDSSRNVKNTSDNDVMGEKDKYIQNPEYMSEYEQPQCNEYNQYHKKNSQCLGMVKDHAQETTVLREDSTTVLYDSASARARPIFALASTKDETRKHFLTQPYTVFGRGTEVTCQIDNKTVSRVHARIFENGDDLMIEDMGSRNGTFINGCMISQGKSYVINEGDLLRFGNEEYRVLYDVV